MNESDRYSLILDKDRFEQVVLLQGRGCFWKNCTFCDYYLDSAEDDISIDNNNLILDKIRKDTKRLTVINSGSFFELPLETRKRVVQICFENNIEHLTIEAHWKYARQVEELRERLRNLGIKLHPRVGIETFNTYFREQVLNKGFGYVNVKDLARVFDECCLLFGVEGQTIRQLEKDIDIALENFKDVYLNIYEQRTELPEDKKLIEKFLKDKYSKLNKINNLHILVNNTDLGVGD